MKKSSLQMLRVVSMLMLAAMSLSLRENVRFTALDPDVTPPSDFWMPLDNPVPENYVEYPRYPEVPSPGGIPMDILYELYPNGTVPKVPAKPTNVWQKNLWGFHFDDY